ncbi:MAG: hypothetical protein HY778_03880 [Betaproteobacteria bacterium]|nr:hypothetical protein [Betaproteobacteria bacterium]
MRIESMHFRQRASRRLDDAVLQANLRAARLKFVDGRARAIGDIPDFEALREAGRRIRVLGLAPEWTSGRDFPAPEPRTFRERWQAGERPGTPYGARP